MNPCPICGKKVVAGGFIANGHVIWHEPPNDGGRRFLSCPVLGDLRLPIGGAA